MAPQILVKRQLLPGQVYTTPGPGEQQSETISAQASSQQPTGSGLPQTSSGSGSSTAAILGATIGGVVFLLAVLLVLLRKRITRRLRQPRATTSPETVQTGPAIVTINNDASRRNRRHDSGRTVRTIPSYSADPDASELVLIPASVAEQEELWNANASTLSLDAASTEELSLRETTTRDLSSSDLPLLAPPEYAYRSRGRSSSEPPLPSEDALSLVSTRSSGLLPPPTQRPSSFIEPSGRRPSRLRESFYNLGHARSRSRQSLPQADNTSRSSLAISAPLSGSLAQSGYIYPRAGMTDAQMSFISSRESLSKLGVYPSVGGYDPPTFENATMSSSLDV